MVINMEIYPEVEQYMKTAKMKYIKNSQQFMTGLASATDKKYAYEVGNQLNARAKGEPVSNDAFYKLKNKSLNGSLFISAAFDSGVFRHIGNLIIDKKDLFNGNVLDMCCDCGIVTCFMAKMYPNCHFVGIDKNQLAINNAVEFAQKQKLENVEFKCMDVEDAPALGKFNLITSFRCLLDVTDKKTKKLPKFGEFEYVEKLYQQAFSDYSSQISSCLNENGSLISVERYGASYGWLGWLNALNANGLCFDENDCTIMFAKDISSLKEYSVTVCSKNANDLTPKDIYNNAMMKKYHPGKPADGANARFALYQQAVGEIRFTNIYKEDKLIHCFAFAKADGDKNMYFDACADSQKLKFYNDKKAESVNNEYKRTLKLFEDAGNFTIKSNTITL